MSALVGGLKDKGKISNSNNLHHQQYFLTHASSEVKNKMDKNGFRYDSAVAIESMLQTELRQNVNYSKPFETFQKNVLKNATKSKEKNLELIKDWIKSESLDDTKLSEELDEKLVLHAKGYSFFAK